MTPRHYTIATGILLSAVVLLFSYALGRHLSPQPTNNFGDVSLSQTASSDTLTTFRTNVNAAFSAIQNVLNNFSTTTVNTFTARQNFSAGASSTQLSVFQRAYIGDTATTTILGSATSTFGAGVEATYLNITGTAATSTFAGGANIARINTSATSTGSQGFNLSGGCFAVNGTCVGASSVSGGNPTATIGLTAVNGSASTYLRSDGAPALSQAIQPTWSALHLFSAGASSTQFSIFSRLYVGDTSTTTILGSATSTFGAGVQTTALNVTGSASSTFANGLQLSAGCFRMPDGSCAGTGNGTVGSGTAGQFPYYASAGSTLTATSALFIDTSTGYIGIGTTTVPRPLTVVSPENVSPTAFFAHIYDSGATYVNQRFIGYLPTSTTATSGTGHGIFFYLATSTPANTFGNPQGGIVTSRASTNDRTSYMRLWPYTNGAASLSYVVLDGTTQNVMFATTTATTNGYAFQNPNSQANIANFYSTLGTSRLRVTDTGITTMLYASSTAHTATNSYADTASSTSLIVSGVPSAVLVTNSSGTVAAATTQTCANQFVRALSAAYVATCDPVSLTADVTGTLAVGNGGTGWATINSGTILVGNGSSALSTTTPSSAFSNSGGTLSNVVRGCAFTYGTSTAWTGTTTLECIVDLPFTLNGVRCRTKKGVGTVNLQIGKGSASTTMINASSTINYHAFTSNNSFSAGDVLFVDIGTPASSPIGVSCTPRVTI